VAAERIFADERRLLAIQKELSIAREIQSSILPRSDPAISRLRVSAAYRPMTAVAGDFYEFVPVDRNRVGFLVADVSGHGVPAALFASMIKVAMQAVASRAHEPGEVLRGLNRILSAQLRGQLVSAAYLWLDTEGRRGLYSAAGHPPLLCWRNGELRRVESNGLLFGVRPDSDYRYVTCRLTPEIASCFIPTAPPSPRTPRARRSEITSWKRSSAMFNCALPPRCRAVC